MNDSPIGENSRMFDVGEPRKRPDQELWDALEEHFGIVRTKDERGRRNAAIRQLLEAGTTPEEVRIACEFCARKFTTYTEKAVAGWLSRAIQEHQRSTGNRDTFLRLLKGGQ